MCDLVGAASTLRQPFGFVCKKQKWQVRSSGASLVMEDGEVFYFFLIYRTCLLGKDPAEGDCTANSQFGGTLCLSHPDRPIGKGLFPLRVRLFFFHRSDNAATAVVLLSLTAVSPSGTFKRSLLQLPHGLITAK